MKGNDKKVSSCFMDSGKVKGVSKGNHARPSTFLTELERPNPYYGVMEEMFDSIQSSDIINKISCRVEDFVVDGVLDEEAYLEAMLAEYGDDLDELLDIAEKEPEQLAVVPPAPSPKVLYKHAGVEKLVDVGSGDCAKLAKVGNQVIATDIAPQANPSFVVRKVDANTEEIALLAERENAILTSFNVLTQLENLDHVSSVDGLHVFPDTEYLRKATLCVVEGNTIVTKAPSGKEFRDVQHELLKDKDVVCPGYKAATFFSSRKATLTPVARFEGDAFSVPISDLNNKPLRGRATPKYDGVAVLVAVNNGFAYARQRDGKGVKFKVSGDVPDCTILLEKLPRAGPAKFYVLTRIVAYRKFVPFHSLSTLIEFCTKVRIKIADAPIVPPGAQEIELYPTDGLIYRFGENDFRYKEVPTVDVSDPYSLIDRLSEEYGLTVVLVPSTPRMGLSEYSFSTMRSGEVAMKFMRKRTDKAVETDISVVVNAIYRSC